MLITSWMTSLRMYFGPPTRNIRTRRRSRERGRIRSHGRRRDSQRVIPAIVEVMEPRALLSKGEITNCDLDPVGFEYGTLLEDSQLHGVAFAFVSGHFVPVDGTFSYGVNVGKRLPAGSLQFETVIFTPYDTANFDSEISSVEIDVTPKDLHVTSFQAFDKTYDGSGNASVAFTDDRIAGDRLTEDYTAYFDSKDAGLQPVNVDLVSISGPDAGNYNFHENIYNLVANILPRPLTITITGGSKVYDGSTNAPVTLSDDRVPGDDVTLNYTANFNDKNVGTNKTFTLSGISLSDFSLDSHNYTLNTVPSSTSANITSRVLTITAAAANKDYDGTANAIVTLSDNRVTNDVFTLSYTGAAFADPNLGAGKLVNVSGISISGPDAGNYTFNTNAVSSADITSFVTSVTTTVNNLQNGNQDLNERKAVTLNVNFSTSVAVNTSGGAPTLSLDDGGVAYFTGGSGTSALSFLYTVASPQNTSDLYVTAFNLNGATIQAGGANADLKAAVMNPSGILQVDTIAPMASIALVGSSKIVSANTPPGTALSFSVTFSEPVTNVDVSGFTLTTAGVAGATISNVTQGIDAAHYTVTVNSGTGVGTVGLNLVGNKITDLAGNGFGGGNFGAQQTFATGALSTSVALGDVNGDGNLDLAVANFLSNTASVLLGNGNGTFQAQQTFTTGNRPRSVTLGDVNGDGKLDLAVANIGSSAVSMLLGNGDGTFQTQQTFATGSDPDSLMLGDVNGDGKLDLTLANYFGNSVSVLLGNGNGTFQTQQTFSTGIHPRSVTLGDLNGDGKLDLAVANYSSNMVSVLLGNGNGTFQAQQTFATGSHPYSVTLGDVNGDGKPDLAVANYSSNTVGVLLGNGNGTFQAQQAFATGYPISVALGDVNGDGKTDLTVANKYSNTVSVLLGKGNGTFQTPKTLAAGSYPISVVLGDLNGDGKPDLAAANAGSNTVSVLLNGNSAQVGPVFTLEPTVTSIVASGSGITNGNGDLNAGKTVTLTANFGGAVTVNTAGGSPTLTLNDGGTATYTGGTGTTALTFIYTVASGQTTSDLTVSSFNLNGATIQTGGVNANVTISGSVGNPAGILQVDTNVPTTTITLANSSNQVAGSILSYTVVFSEPVIGVDASDFSLTTTGVTGATITSVSQGADASHYTVTVSSGTGAGTVGLNIIGNKITDLAGNWFGLDAGFAAQQTFATGTRPFSVTTGDVNGDGILDLLTANYASNTVSVLLGNGKGTFQSQPPVAVGNAPYSVVLGDVNGDGKPDLFVANFLGNTVSVLTGNGDGTFKSQPTLVPGGRPDSLAIGDVNGDGRPDVVVANLNNSVSVFLGNGDGTFGSPQTLIAGGTPRSINLADVNRDGKLDIAVANEAGSIGLLFGNGNGTFQAQQTVSTVSSPRALTVVDIDGDGRLDLVVKSYSGSVGVLLQKANGTFTSQATFATGSGPYYMTLGDVSGDGKPDLVIANFKSNSVDIWKGNGNGTFAAPQTFATGAGPRAVTLGDTNGDRHPDLLVADSSGNAISVLLNQAGPTYSLVPVSVLSVTTSGAGITDGTGDINAGKTISLTVNFNAAVTVNADSNGFFPFLILNDGDGAYYVGGSGTTALTFNYTVRAGQNTSDLAVTSFDLNFATVSHAGIDAILTGAVTNPVGTLQIDTVAPNVSVALVGASTQVAGTMLQYAVAFTEAVTGVNSSSFGLRTWGVTGASISSVARTDAAHYTVNVASGSGAGAIRLNLIGSNVTDLAGNDLAPNDYGEGSFAAQQTFAVGSNLASVTLRDLNGDGKPDLAVADEVYSVVYILLGKGDGTFSPPQTFDAGGGGADFDEGG